MLGEGESNDWVEGHDAFAFGLERRRFQRCVLRLAQEDEAEVQMQVAEAQNSYARGSSKKRHGRALSASQDDGGCVL